jgi:4-alpha-glucanotransferase
MAVIILESHRNKCLVVSEDLGTLPPGLRETLQDAGFYSYRLLYFERDADGSRKAPRDYPVEAVAAVSTHDLPTLAGFWAGDDIALRGRIANSNSDLAQALAERARDKESLAAALRAEGFDAAVNQEAPRLALHQYLARAPSRLLVVQFDDVVEEREQFNLPGTDREYPNWRRRYALPVAQLLADPRAQEMFAMLRAERPPLDPRALSG